MFKVGDKLVYIDPFNEDIRIPSYEVSKGVGEGSVYYVKVEAYKWDTALTKTQVYNAYTNKYIRDWVLEESYMCLYEPIPKEPINYIILEE